MDTPILFLIYNRPKITRETFTVIRKYKPKHLFVAADGPKPGDIEEEHNCRLTREATEKIDWNCKIERFYRNQHVGLKGAVYEAITWFFKNVDEGIIIEDDCLVNESFFVFCKNMLSKYRNSSEVMHIGGSNFLPKNIQKKDGYYFSKYDNVWGWASWRRAWDKMDYSMLNWRKFKKSGKFKLVLPNFWERQYWNVIANAVIKGKLNTWAYRWLFSIWENDGKCISPSVNLVENIGLIDSGTHINTNIKGLSAKASVIDREQKLLSDDYSKSADGYAMEHVYRISPAMIFAQWVYNFLI